MIKSLILSAFAILVLCACSEKDKKTDWSEKRQLMETRAQEMLSGARQALIRQDFEKAKNTIEAMRTQCNLALEARQQGILLMDSIYLQEAVNKMMQADSLMKTQTVDSLILVPRLEEFGEKIKFYRRKLEHDKQHL
ncbi:hypothetical protein IMSAGC014_02169 [Bacteroidaceae bacterium]|uniref:hypothetical protein n=1 Tax=Prevotella sp. MGM2 TaxID=2033406 RepID=UPI000CE9E970|nr:hypothetical protein [Prevotella sp. MGM2]GAY30803.1 hypothetical protein PvtlMGM2_1656 [Prevotella sp. MGM2]GFI35648.1 hypothetical protein IMSAGC014_02169 [Bacteroidaceae bacterium]